MHLALKHTVEVKHLILKIHNGDEASTSGGSTCSFKTQNAEEHLFLKHTAKLLVQKHYLPLAIIFHSSILKRPATWLGGKDVV